MTREELLALGLTDEQAGAVLEGLSALQAQIAQLTAALDAAKQADAGTADLAARLAAAQAQLALRDKRDAVLTALGAYKPRDARLLLRLIDLELISVGDGKISGLEEQVRALREAAPYLFLDSPDPVGGTAASGLSPADFDMNAFLRGE